MDGVALRWSDLPLPLIERHKLSERMHDRGGEREIRFLYRDPSPLLPVIHSGRLSIVQWGNRSGGRALPRGGWTKLATVEAGSWAESGAVPTEIPAIAARTRGVWFAVRQGIRGLLVDAEGFRPTVYVIVEPATHYFEVMTRSAWAPVLIEERI